MAAKHMDKSRGGIGVSALAGAVCAATALGLPLGGCSAPRSFPSASGSNGLSADAPPLPQVIADSLNYAHRKLAANSQLVYNLPAEMNLPAWQTYERLLLPGRPMCPADRTAWTVRQARIDGSNAEVDIEYPTRNGVYQLVTVHLDGASGGLGYTPRYYYEWRIPVSEPTCNTPPEVQERACNGAAPTAQTPASRRGSGAVPAGSATPSGTAGAPNTPNLGTTPSGAKPASRPAADPPPGKTEEPNK